MTVVPLFCARFLKAPHHAAVPARSRAAEPDGLMERFNRGFAARFERLSGLV